MGKNDKWDHNYEPDESKLSWALFWKSIRETSDATDEMQSEAAEAENVRGAKRFRWFAKTPLGKWWLPIRSNMKKTKQGRRWLLTFNILQAVFWIGMLFALRPAINWISDGIFPTDYQLTSAQKAEGYDQTLSSGRYASDEGVAYRFYNENEYQNAECLQSYDWCIYALPLWKDCEEVYMEFSTAEKDELFAGTIENKTTTVKPKFGKYFKLGEPVTLGVTVNDPKSQYGSVDHIYCRVP
mgnify:CR=1 FL=1